MIIIEHTYTTVTNILYYSEHAIDKGLEETMIGNMDDIAGHVCEILVRHNFSKADVIDVYTGEIIMIITRE